MAMEVMGRSDKDNKDKGEVRCQACAALPALSQTCHITAAAAPLSGGAMPPPR